MKTIFLCVTLLMPVASAAQADNNDTQPGAEIPAAEVTGAVAVSPIAVAARVENMLIHALSLIGAKYRYGGNSIDHGFDCSGFVRHVFAATLDLELPRNAREMSKRGKPVEDSELLPGDLLFYNTLKRRASHVGIYLGEGRFVHAPSRGKSVEIVDMSDVYWKRRFNSARRLVDPD